VGVAAGPDGVAMTYLDAEGHIGTHLFFEQPDDVEHLLESVVAEQKWQETPCTLVLHPAYYQLLLTDAPAVESAELAQAVRWKIKDLMSFPLEEAAVETFPLPDDAYHGRQKKLYAAAIQKETLQNLVAPVENAGLALDCIDIAELSLQNIALRCAPCEGAMAVLQLFGAEGILNLVEDGEIYFCRRVEIGLELMRHSNDLQKMFDSLVLEIQRSLDFYESQMGKGIITHLHYERGIDGMGEHLSRALPLQVAELDPSHLVGAQVADVSATCMSAIGGALGTVPAGTVPGEKGVARAAG
jgi:MSHA biogenesis protein MshI